MILHRMMSRTHVATLVLAIVTLAACGRDSDVRRSPDTAATRLAIDTPFLAEAPAMEPPGDTALSGMPAPPAEPARIIRRAPPSVPRTAPEDRASVPAQAPASTASEPPTVAPETAAIEPRVVPPPRAPGDGPRPVPSRPFDVGERLTYEVRFGPLRVGTATMEVLGVETVRGRQAYHTRFEVRGGNRFYRVEDRYESWFDVHTLASLRYVQDINEGSYERHSVFEIHPDEQRYVEQGKEPQPSVAQPLDEGSFIYWLRTIPLEVGETYSFDNYFRPDRNPVRIEVLRRERIRVPAGEFDAIVVRPTIRTRGIFSEGGRAEIWFAADSTRRLLQMKSRLSFGSLNLYLR